jgi:hypothetical protein
VLGGEKVETEWREVRKTGGKGEEIRDEKKKIKIRETSRE